MIDLFELQQTLGEGCTVPGLVGEELRGEYRRHIDRISDAIFVQHGQRPVLDSPPTAEEEIAEAEAELEFRLPEVLADLYRVSNGLEGLFEIPALDLLPQMHRETAKFLQDYDIYPDLEGMLWGPRPEGDVINVGAGGGVDLLMEISGPQTGQLTCLWGAGDSGFRWVGPSLEALLDAWAIMAEEGVLILIIDERIETDEDQIDRLYEVVGRTRCSIAACNSPLD